jgi:hypothetical protein
VTLEGKLTHSVDILSIQHHQGNKSFVFWGNKEDRRIFLSVMELSNSGNLFVETLAERSSFPIQLSARFCLSKFCL